MPRCQSMLAGCLLWVALGLAAADPLGPAGILFNEDNSHFFGYYPATQMTRAGLEAFVGEYAGTGVSHLFFCPNAMRTSYASAVREPIWAPAPTGTPTGKWPTHAKLLHDRGLDPYAIWITRCREVGLVPWLSMRMNDAHSTRDLGHYYHSSFWRNHPQYWRHPESRDGTISRALDYAEPEVRAHQMALVRELLERYDPEGLELDWMRFPYHFRPGQEATGVPVLTQFVQEVRGLTRQWGQSRGHPVRLGVRVPTHPDAARGLGLDAVAWAQAGLIDLLVVSPFWETADFDIPVELWRRQLGEAAERLVLAAGLELNLRAFPGGKAGTSDLESVRGFAAAMRHRGADRVYLFNYLSPAPIPGGRKAYRELLETGLESSAVAALPRRHVVTFTDTVPKGFPRTLALPRPIAAESEFRLYTGPVPQQGPVVLLVGIETQASPTEPPLSAHLNGTQCTPIAAPATAALPPGATAAVAFACPLSALAEGQNVVHLRPCAGGILGRIVWFELRFGCDARCGSPGNANLPIGSD